MKGLATMSDDVLQKHVDGSDHADMPSVCIAIAVHKPYQMPVDSIYMPLHVGKALHPEINLGFQTDDTGDNISALNASYSELTGLYWLWKNCDADFKGLVHYRRYLASPDFRRRHAKNRFERISSGNEIRELLRESGIILPRKRNYYIETLQSHYAHTLPEIHLVETRRILEDHCPEYLPAFNHVMQSRSGHMFNMFIMSNEKLNEYCTWLFDILKDLTNHIDPSQYDAFNARFPGRVSELLLDVWLETNGYSYKELPVVSTEPVNWWKKGTGFLMAKFVGKKYTKSF